MKVHAAIARTLREQRVDVMFGLVGDGNLFLVESYRKRGGRYVPFAHEASVVLGCAGYYRTSGRLGVGTVTHGPGLSNTVTGLIEAVKARVPVLLIAGDTAQTDLENFQDIAQRELVEACGAGFVRARSPQLIERDLVCAVREALIGRRPVVFNVPADFQFEEASGDSPPLVTYDWGPVGPDPERLEEAVGVLAAARRPLLLAGRGAVAAREEILALAEGLGAPVATTVQARQLFDSTPFDLGIFGTLSTAESAVVIGEADCIVAFGASLNRLTTANGALLEGRRVVQVDRDPDALGRHAEVTVAIQGDARRSARAMMELLVQAELSPSGFAGPALADRLAQAAEDRAESVAQLRLRELARERDGKRPSGTVDLTLAVNTVEAGFPADRTLVIDAGRHMISALAVYTVVDPTAYVHTTHFGAIGVGMPYAIGAALGAPQRPTLLVCGDGGFMLGGLVEFSTAVREALDITVVVMNDGCYGAEHIQLVNRGFDTDVSMLDVPPLHPVAESLGGWGRTIATIEDLDSSLAALGESPGPKLLDVHISAHEISAAG